MPNNFKIRFQVALSRNGQTRFYPFTGLHQYQHPNQFRIVETTETKMPRSSLDYITGNLKHIVRYVGADADLWRGMAYLGVFCRTQCKHCKASRNLQTEQKRNLGENSLIEMNLLMLKNDPVIV